MPPFFSALTKTQWAAAVSTLVLTVGVLIEYRELLPKLIKLAGRILTLRSSSFERCVWWRLAKHSLGPILVALGIGGELVFEAESFREDNRAAIDSNKQIIVAQGDAGTAQLKLAQLQLKMLAIFGPRHLDEAAKDRIAGKLKPLGRVKVDVYAFAVGNPFSESESTESKALAIELVEALGRARLDAVGWLEDKCHESGASNVVLVVPSDDATFRSQATAIIAALEPEVGTYPEVADFGPSCDSSVALTPHKVSRSDDANIRILVGRKIPTLPTAETLGIDIPKQ
jgi:hypothetical protein